MMSAQAAFGPLRAALEGAGIRYAVGGSWASTAYGEPRFTHAVDIVADFDAEKLTSFLLALPSDFYADAEEASTALRFGRPFNVNFMPTAFKFDFFPALAFPLGAEELDRAVFLEGSGLSESRTPFVTPEDIVLAKIYWFQAGGEVSTVQWRDITGIVRARRDSLDGRYLE